MEIQSACMAAAAAAVLLIAMLRLRPDATGWLFTALIGAFGAWSGARAALELGWSDASHVATLALVAMGVLVPTTAARFTEGRGSPRGLWVALIAGPGALAGAALALGVEHPVVHSGAQVWAAGGVFTGVTLLSRYGAGPEAGDGPDAVRVRYLAVALSTVVFGIAADLVCVALDAPRVGALLTPLLYLYAGYLQLARVRVADLRQQMGNAISLALLAGGLAVFFGALSLWVGPRLDLFVFNAFVVSLLLLLLLGRGRDRIQRAIDRRFVASRVDLESRLKPLREQLSHMLTLDACISELLEAVEHIDRLRTSAVFLRDDPHVGFQQVGSVGLPPRRRVNLIRNPTWVQALELGDPILREELDKLLAAGRGDSERLKCVRRIMAQLDAQLALPLRTENHLLGFWTLSDERVSEPFSSSELELLRQVADETALAMENSKTFERVRARDRLADLGEMAAGLAHEIRNPLATIRGAVAVLSESEGDPGEFQDVIVQEIERLDRVVGTFLDYAKPEAGSTPIEHLGRFVRDCVESVAAPYADQEVELSVDVGPDLPHAIANQDQLERVIVNLALNAFQAVDGKGTIEVSVRRGTPDPELATCVEIVIADDGPGMDDATLDRAAVPFFTTREEGTGLGLALCDRLVRAQGGTLRMLSRPGMGTSAVVRLPAVSDVPDGEPVEDGT
jgi:signal transduction histidine kinase